MSRIKLPVCGLLMMMAASCATPNTATHPGHEANIPVFRDDDERVGTAGFVAKTLRLHRERNGARHTLMAFVVGDTLTLGAMVRGAFVGEVRWQIGECTLSFRLDTETSLRNVPVIATGKHGAPLQGQGAAFRGTSWVNVEVPAADWVSDGTALRLIFVPDTDGQPDIRPLILPDVDHHYVIRLTAQ